MDNDAGTEWFSLWLNCWRFWPRWANLSCYHTLWSFEIGKRGCDSIRALPLPPFENEKKSTEVAKLKERLSNRSSYLKSTFHGIPFPGR